MVGSNILKYPSNVILLQYALSKVIGDFFTAKVKPEYANRTVLILAGV